MLSPRRQYGAINWCSNNREFVPEEVPDRTVWVNIHAAQALAPKTRNVFFWGFWSIMDSCTSFLVSYLGIFDRSNNASDLNCSILFRKKKNESIRLPHTYDCQNRKKTRALSSDLPTRCGFIVDKKTRVRLEPLHKSRLFKTRWRIRFRAPMLRSILLQETDGPF